jgi:hypothetical protein
MKKSIIFGGILVVLLVFIGIILYFMVTDNSMLGGFNNSYHVKANASIISPWSVSGIGPVSDLHIDNGTIYAFMGNSSNTIYAIDLSGNVKWIYNVSDNWRVLNAYYDASVNFTSYKSVYDVYNGVLYLYVRENRTTLWNHLLNDDHPDQAQAGDWDLEDCLMAISSNGSLLWDVPISTEHHVYDDMELTVLDNRVYVFDNYTLTVLNLQGMILYQIKNVSNWPAIGENGNVYMVPGVLLTPQPAQLVNYYMDTGYMVPSSAIEAFSPNGSLYWQIDLGTQIISPLLCQNGTLWAPVQNGIVALNTNGSIRWSKYYNITPEPFWGGAIGLYSSLPLDSQDNVYLYEEGTGDPLMSTKTIHIISLNGTETVHNANSFTPYEPNNSIIFQPSFYNGGGQAMNVTPGQTTLPVDIMMNCTVTAYDAADNNNLWNYTIVPNITDTVITNDNLDKLLNPKYRYNNASIGTFVDWYPVSILPGNDTVFVIYSCANIQSPIIINKSECGYCIEIYAFDKTNGKLLWTKNLDTLITSSSVYGNTLYYGTLDGKVYAQTIE